MDTSGHLTIVILILPEQLLEGEMVCAESWYTNGTYGPKHPTVPHEAWWLQTHTFVLEVIRQNGHHTEHTGYYKQFSILLCYSTCAICNIFLHNMATEQNVNGLTYHVSASVCVNARECAHIHTHTQTRTGGVRYDDCVANTCTEMPNL